MKLFKKRLREKVSDNKLTISWYQVIFFDFVALFLMACIGMYLIAGFLGWEELRGLKVVELNLQTKSILYGILFLLLFYLLGNRKTVLMIEAGQVRLIKRRISGKRWHFSKKEISSIESKLQKVHYENEVGSYPDVYTVSIVLRNGKIIRLGGFNEEDASRLKVCLKK